MAQTARPTAKRVLLGHELAYVRTNLGMSQAEAGSAIGAKGNYRMALLEAGRATITRDNLHTLLAKLEVTDDDHRAAILALHTDSHKHGDWKTGYKRAYGEDLRLLIDLERHADQIFLSQVEIVPGLMHVESFTRTLAQRKRLPKGITAEQIVQAWQARQSIIGDGKTQVHAVLSESCLRRRYAPAEIMREQMEHLLALSERPGVLLQVLPFESPADGTLVWENGSMVPYSFTLLRVPSPGRAGALRMVYSEGVSEYRYRDEPETIDTHEAERTTLTAAALSAEDSRQFIEYISGTFR